MQKKPPAVFLAAFIGGIVLLLTGCPALAATNAVKTATTNAVKSIRVMSYNIHHAEGADGKINVKRIAALIKREKVDIVGLQEIDRGVRRTSGRDIIAELSKLTGMEFYFDRNIFYQGGEYGNAVLTRFPILEKKNTHFKMLYPNEQRGVQQVLLDVEGRKLLFMNTHIDYRPEDTERLTHVKELRQIVENRGKHPVIMCGDFNSYPHSRVIKNMNEFMLDAWTAGKGDGFTYPAAKADNRIDYIFVSKDDVIPLKVWVPQSIASDHLPVVGDFELR